MMLHAKTAFTNNVSSQVSTITVKDGDKTLTLNRDYAVSGECNLNNCADRIVDMKSSIKKNS